MNENKNTEKKTSFNMKHGSTTYIVNVRFAEESKTTFGDILKGRVRGLHQEICIIARGKIILDKS